MLELVVDFVQWIELDDELSNDDRFESYDSSVDAICDQLEERNKSIDQCYELIDEFMRILV